MPTLPGRLPTAALSSTLLAFTLLTAVPTARAADPNPWDGVTWSTPEAVTPAGVSVSGGAVSRAADGSELALWTAGSPSQVFASTRPAAGSWSAPQQITDYVQYSGFANFSWSLNNGAAVVHWMQYDTGTSEWEIRAVSRGASGSWSAPATIARTTPGQVGDIRQNPGRSSDVRPDGTAVIAFVADEPIEADSDNFGPDSEVFKVSGSGGSWSAPSEVSVEPVTPAPPICTEPDPTDCPDVEGDSLQPLAAFDGAGSEWIGWIHREGEAEPAEVAGVHLLGPDGPMILANSSEALPRTFELSGIAGDRDAAGVALAWTRTVPDAAGKELWAFHGVDVGGPQVRVATAAENASLRGIAADNGHALAVVGVGSSGIDGSRRLTAARRIAGNATWSASAPMEYEGGDVYGTSGRAVLTPDGTPVVAYVDDEDGVALTPTTERWADSEFNATRSVVGQFVQTFQATETGLLGSWLSSDGGVNRLFTSSSTGFPGSPPPPPPVPVPAMTAPKLATTTSHPVTLTPTHVVRWQDVDTSGYDVRRRVAPWNGTIGSAAAWRSTTATSATDTVAKGRTWCYAVRARRDSGATSGWSSERCTITPLDQISVARSAGWKKVSSSAFFGGSAHYTTKKGATLTRTGAQLKRVGLVATTCRTCGVVDVFVGATRVGRINLARNAATKNKQVLLLRTFAARKATVKVKVVSTRKLVRIDGLVLGRH